MNLEDNKKAFMELLRIPSVTGSGADGEEKACAFLEHILQENGIKTERIAKDLHRPNLLAAIHAPRAEKEPVVLISHIDVVPAYRRNGHIRCSEPRKQTGEFSEEERWIPSS